MAQWSIEKLNESLKRILGEQLISVILYGSAAAGDHAGQKIGHECSSGNP